MNRDLWTQPLSKSFCPAWPCPVCRKGSVALVQKSLICKETVESKRGHDDEGWDPTCVAFTFTAWGQCTHASCKQEFAVAGTGGVEPEFGPDDNYDWADYFLPKFCHPMPDMFDITPKCPDSIKEELRGAFALFWSNHAACAGRIRVALECLMNHLGVPKRRKDGSGKYHDLSLHARIDLFAQNEPATGPQLMALKWLGNTGSHEAQVARNDLLDAFEIMEHALVEIIDRRSARVATLAKKLTRKYAN